MRIKWRFLGKGCQLLFFICIISALSACETELFNKKFQNETAVTNENVRGKRETKPGRKKVATIYKFRSSVAGISSKGATDMFTTALVKTGAFAVAERQQLHKGVEREKQLKSTGKATGKAKGGRLTGADYIFEGTVSEFNAKESEDETAISLSGMEVNSSSNAGSIGLDVRVIEANTGKVVEAVNVSRQIGSSGSGVSGFGSAISSLAGRGSSMTPDVNIKRARQDGLDKAVRECIEEAVCKIADRLSSD
jgi:curli biogenesis system outer membrane secretion channel CsgG